MPAIAPLSARPCDLFMTIKQNEWVKGFPTFKTLASLVGTGTSKDALSEETAYKLTKAMMEPAAVDSIASSAKFIKGWSFRERTLELASIPLHKGAVKYFKEIGDKVPEQLIPPEAK